MTYSKIVNPKTGRKVSINGRIGREILKQYLNVLTGGGLKREEGSRELSLPFIEIKKNEKEEEWCDDVGRAVKVGDVDISKWAVEGSDEEKGDYDKYLCQCARKREELQDWCKGLYRQE